jgi:hypothetical protein
MLERLTLTAADDEFTDLSELGIGKLPLEVQVEPQALQFEDMREEEFGLEAGGIHAFLRKKIGTLLDDFQNLHGGSLCGKEAVEQLRQGS